ncbi:VCBS repeat-containing protein [Planctomycetota bacterium]|nr:VCBS repeat-containing protein [Planctomycetota bacterium]
MKNKMIPLWFVFLLLFFCNNVIAQVTSGTRVSTNNNDWGILSKGISCNVLGAINTHGGKRPDVLLVGANGYNSQKGIYLYKYAGKGKEGQPRFIEKQRVRTPFEIRKNTPRGHAFKGNDGRVHVWLIQNNQITRYVLDKKKVALVQSAEPLEISNFNGSVNMLSASPQPDGSIHLALLVHDKVAYMPKGSWRHPRYYSFNGRGVWRGNWVYVHLEQAILKNIYADDFEQIADISGDNKDILHRAGQIARVQFEPKGKEHLIVGSWYGQFHFYENSGNDSKLSKYKSGLFVKNEESGLIHRHPAINPHTIQFPNYKTGLNSDIIAGGESGLYWYEFSGEFDTEGNPIYKSPKYVLSKKAPLYLGSLPVLNSVDWDGDNDEDLIVGNSQGFVLFCENVGSNRSPRYKNGVPVAAGGEVIMESPGYRGIQGPQESRWGYTSPTVVDWDEDGDLDLVLRSSADEQYICINVGSRTEPRLARKQRLYCRGLELHGTWRVQPAVGKMGSRMVYITLDDDDEFHWYQRIDNQNVKDLGKLHLEDGSNISANFIDAGGTGRLKMVLVDWDLDGKKDLMVSGPRHASVPNKENGLPKETGKSSTGLKGASVLFMKNVGTDLEPSYAFPVYIKYKDKPLRVGQHACSGVPTNIGISRKPNMLLGFEDGFVYFYDRKDLSWD